MLRITTLYVIFLYSFNFISAQEETSRPNEFWNSNSAYLMPAGKWESGIFQPFRYGLNKKLELRTNFLMIPLIPQAGIRIALRSGEGLILSSEHTIGSPTLFLRLVSRKGTGGLISPEFDIPFSVSVSNSILLSKHLNTKTLINLNAGYIFSIRKSKPETQASIDFPLLYPRFAHVYDRSTVKLGLSLTGTFYEKWHYEEGISSFIVLRNQYNFFLENSGKLVWSIGKSLHLKGGYVLSYGKYPFGNYWQLWPAFNVMFGSGK